MPIKEISFRIGCGRYLQGENIISKAGEEIARLGSAPMVIGDDNGLAAAGDILLDSIKGSSRKYEISVHNGTCNDESAIAIAEIMKKREFDIVVGVGGGVIMDFAKLCAYYAKCPVINIPTSSATCAAYTPLSVRYTPDGRTVGSLHYGYEVDGVICDTSIMIKQPIRLFLAGVFDALAKFIEIKQRYREESSAEAPLGLDYAYLLSKYTFEIFTKDTADCIEDMKKGKITEKFEKIIFASIATTGVISGIARGSNQTALGHKFYEKTRLLYPKESKQHLHGEIVGIGLLLQNRFNGETENNAFLTELMKKYELPSQISDIGIPPTEDAKQKYISELIGTSAIDEESSDDIERLKNSLDYLWSLSGK